MPENLASVGWCAVARKIVALILNLFFPGIGTMLLGRGAIQFGRSIVGAAVRRGAGLMSPVGDMLVLSMWLWAVIVSVQAFSRTA